MLKVTELLFIGYIVQNSNWKYILTSLLDALINSVAIKSAKLMDLSFSRPHCTNHLIAKNVDSLSVIGTGTLNKNNW